MGKLIIGVNDLETWCEENDMNYLIEEWNDEKSIANFTKGSRYEANWKCRACGHEWRARIGHRTCDRTGCPKCNNQTSFAEQTILYYAKQYFPTIISRYSDLGFELDIYIPSIKTAIEYDGLIYHKHKSKMEKNKNQQCKNNDITLIRIREEGLCEYSDCVCIFRKNSKDINNFNAVLKKLFDCLNISDVDIDIYRDYSKILENYKTLFLKNSLSIKRPKIAAEWHPTLNGKLKPENFNYGSSHAAWWQCDKGHEWQAIIKDRSRNRHNCPYCIGRRILTGFNDLQTWCEENDMNHLVEEWNDEKSITNFTKGSRYKANWKCRTCGHEWRARIKDRSRNRHNCPYCVGRRILTGFNDLQTWCEENDMNYLIEEWDDESKITDFTKGSHYEANWKCRSCGYKWQARIGHRTGDKHNCPYCSGHRALVGANNLQTWCEENDMNYLIEEWDDESKITDFTKGSHYEANWKCRSCGYKWQARIGHRVLDRTGCPKCAKKCRSKKTRKVLCIDTGEVFDSTLIASQAKNAPASCISYCCKGKRKTAGGYHWEYVDK